jgi:hypothetical protein
MIVYPARSISARIGVLKSVAEAYRAPFGTV